MWQGTNPGGHAFELVGIQIDTHGDHVLVTDEWVAHPHPNAYVSEAILGEGTPVTRYFWKLVLELPHSWLSSRLTSRGSSISMPRGISRDRRPGT